MANVNNGFLRLRLDQLFGRREANVWLSTYGLPSEQVEAFRDRWRAKLETLLR